MTADPPLLEIRDLEMHFDQRSSIIDSILKRNLAKIQAVDGVSFRLEKNQSRGVIGESGCGKTTLLLTLMGLYDPTGGVLEYKGEDVSEFGRRRWREFRGNVSIIFQDPFNALDPKLTVHDALMEPLKIHKMDDRETRIREILRKVELQPVENYLDRRPNQLSGGELQRVSIARALIVDPEVILADEPVSMLDVSTQAAILTLLSDLIDDLSVSMLYISHDLSTVSYVCDNISVMYRGRIIETAATPKLLDDPLHPYSQALINAIPIPDPYNTRERTRMEGAAPDPINIGEGCRFRDRCPERMDICEKTPVSVNYEDQRTVACHLYYDHDEYASTDEQSNAKNRKHVTGTTIEGMDSR